MILTRKQGAALIAAFLVLWTLAFLLLPGATNDAGVRPHLPKLGQPVTKPAIVAAQKEAVENCPLTKGEATQRKVVNGAPGVQKAVDHDAGDCNPQTFENKASVVSHSALIGDWSNNDPIYGLVWRTVRSHGIQGAWLKLNEGTGFVDRTAAAMAASARAAHVVPGGYDFAHVCLVSADAEANLFISRLRALHLYGPDSLRPIIDAEYGGCSTGAGSRIWIARVVYVVSHALHTRVGVYSGNWWLVPHTDCLFAHLPKDTLSWISGYPNAVAPCGHALDVHQFSDSYSNGVNHSDMSRLVSATGADVLATGAPVAPKEATHQCRMHKHYAAWYLKYRARDRKLGGDGDGSKLGEFGRTRLAAANAHLKYERRYFTKNHEHGKANYDCHADGTVTVRAP